ncbi:TPA: hypothetical protein N0F65_004950 [Lagenidium giganteum]|uniref:Uncharacterized protein n=1 Tax=Lagenidium giganteum TaxID=4803 RepID=A0AAV2YZB8_9STRA|nr:TPA: hypothetical protein N0F65_004950 [Lagenidium giganteum]
MTINSAQTIWSSIAKHSSARYGDIVSLLLKHGLPRGRLAGDGVETTLMHYAATLEDPVSSSQIITSLLECDGGDINVPDAFGNTPITYSLASGRLQQACDILLLETTPRARLEAEFEGQSMFYYTLQLLPSLSWRLLLQQLLIRMRNRAFLHCVAEDGCCACKSFESPDSEREHQESESECTFCCHQASYHTRVPFPPWFTDQYETYLGIASDHTSPRNDDEYQFTESNSKGTREEEIENTRGRLDNSALRLVTAARYGDLIRSFGLFGECHEAESSGAIPAEDINEQVMPSKKRRSKPNWNTTWDTPTSAWAMTTTGETKVDENPNPAIETSGSTEADESNLPSCAHFRVLRQPVPMLQCRSLPQSYRCELKAIHSATCTCFKPELFVSPEQVQYATICRWLRTDTSNQLGSLTSQQSDLDKLKNAWKRWHDHTRSSIQVCSQVPVDGLPELDGAQRKHRHRQLRAYLLHWRSALLFQAFFRWKHSNQSYGLMHHNVETVADQLSDVKRLIRRKELQRQHLQMVQAVATFNARHQRHRHVVAD